MKFLYDIINEILPVNCSICGIFSKNLICDHCIKKIQFITSGYCSVCGVLCGDVNINGKCFDCIAEPPFFNSIRAVVFYDKVAANLLHKFKFYDHTNLAKYFAKIMLKYSAGILDGINCIVPVPIHRFRMISRRYNQSILIARYISKMSQINLNVNSFFRIKNTTKQHFLKANKRFENIKNAFIVKDRGLINGKNILIIDDLVTTCATINECSKVLLEAGAVSVNCLALFRASKF